MSRLLNNGKPWTSVQVYILTRLVLENASMGLMEHVMQRTRGSLRSKIYKTLQESKLPPAKLFSEKYQRGGPHEVYAAWYQLMRDYVKEGGKLDIMEDRRVAETAASLGLVAAMYSGYKIVYKGPEEYQVLDDDIYPTLIGRGANQKSSDELPSSIASKIRGMLFDSTDVSSTYIPMPRQVDQKWYDDNIDIINMFIHPAMQLMRFDANFPDFLMKLYNRIALALLDTQQEEMRKHVPPTEWVVPVCVYAYSAEEAADMVGTAMDQFIEEGDDYRIMDTKPC